MPSNSDTAFETTFANLAAATLQDRSPTLMEYLLGFQVLDSNDDQTKAVGIFGVKIGNEMIYLPVFFANGELKGHELMYLKNQDIFCPSEESWVTYITNKKPYMFGEQSNKNYGDLASMGVDFSAFRNSPEMYSSKSASANYLGTFECPNSRGGTRLPLYGPTDGSQEFLAKLGTALTKTVMAGDKSSPIQSFLKKAGAKPLAKLGNSMKGNIKLAESVLQYYSPQNLMEMLETTKKADVGQGLINQLNDTVRKHGTMIGDHSGGVAGLATGALGGLGIGALGGTLLSGTDKDGKRKNGVLNAVLGGAGGAALGGLVGNSFGSNLGRAAANKMDNEMIAGTYKQSDVILPEGQKGDVKILTAKEIDTWDAFGLSDADKTKLLHGEIVIHDNRDGTPRVYNADSKIVAQTPSTTAIYDVLLEDGEYKKCWLLHNPVKVDDASGIATRSSWQGGATSNVLSQIWCIPLEGQGCCKSRPDEIFATPIHTEFGEDVSDTKLQDLSNISKGGVYAIVSPNMDSIQPFYVLDVIETAEGMKTLVVTENLDPDEWCLNSPSKDKVKIVLSPATGSKLRRVVNTIFAPLSCKCLKLSIKPRPKVNGSSFSSDSDTFGMCRPANANEVANLLWQGNKVVPLRLHSTGSEYALTLQRSDGIQEKTSGLSRRGMLNDLVFRLGINGNTALDMIKKAEQTNSVRPAKFLLEKKASPFLTQGAPQSPIPYEVAPTMDSSVGVPVQGESQSNIPIPGMGAAPSARQIYDPNPQLDQSSQQLLNGAAQTGQKEVFDAALLGGLVKSTDNNGLVDSFIGDLILGMDRVGRIYFLFLQNNEKFEERYGSEDMLELEDNLRNTFKSMGELIMFLKQKTVEKNPSRDRTEIKF